MVRTVAWDQQTTTVESGRQEQIGEYSRLVALPPANAPGLHDVERNFKTYHFMGGNGLFFELFQREQG